MPRFQLPEVSYSKSGLSPLFSPETMEFHYGRHHKNYIEKMNKLLTDSSLAYLPLEEIILSSDPGELLNNALQSWNHTFFWNCLVQIPGKLDDTPDLARLLKNEFGSFENFQSEFNKAAGKIFGSGWAWLVLGEHERLEIMTTANGDNPLLYDKLPLLTCDVWEHAYYIDYRNGRDDYLKRFWTNVNWSFVNQVLVSRDIAFIGEQMETEKLIKSA